MIRGINHAGFVVRDLEAAVRFYEEIVGLRVQDRLERTGEPISQVVGYDGAHLKIAKMAAEGEEHFLELIEYVQPPSAERASEERAIIAGATWRSSSTTSRPPSSEWWRTEQSK